MNLDASCVTKQPKLRPTSTCHLTMQYIIVHQEKNEEVNGRNALECCANTIGAIGCVDLRCWELHLKTLPNCCCYFLLCILLLHGSDGTLDRILLKLWSHHGLLDDRWLRHGPPSSQTKRCTLFLWNRSHRFVDVGDLLGTFYNCTTRNEYLRSQIFVSLPYYFFFSFFFLVSTLWFSRNVYHGVEEFPVRQKK